jgi:hypothetical protein
MKYSVYNHNYTLLGRFKTRKAAEAEATYYREQTGNAAFVEASVLTGAALDWAVSKCEYTKPVQIGSSTVMVFKDVPFDYYPSTDWAQGGPIIERERITIEWTGDPDSWCACIMADQEVYGPTPLIAAMRVYVASKLGDEVEIPEELEVIA